MADLRMITKDRLSIVFKGDTQEVTARKLNTTQGNVSKWLNGSQIPTPDMLLEISKAYKISVDWILGISEHPEIDGLAVEKLTYEQIAKVLDRLIENNTIEVPDLTLTAEEKGLMKYIDPEIVDEDDEETREPLLDPDYIKIKDRLLSYIMRRRQKLASVDLEMLDTWKEKLDNFNGLKLLKYDEKIQEAIDLKGPAQFKDGDWVELFRYLDTLNPVDLHRIVEELKEKDGKN
ncbi:helix-turn-helix domain-containing protein [[Ruminococcus] torques]|uniref:helix-turn-helix domain-containing protein n=1 Tax=[Ruminococcus] torques TaxID=33039 RepID=UPI001D06E46D|nr:helix-turn-helix domain-containing protein [[Ruminococcus] torques]MCB7250498.1 helix-turn-helix domain-containing protein [[Ruminococcus] torques]MCG4856149.1 helix-turn-helix domain-containing protein [[Ruminococcus] torques]MCG5029040.1 helix-turn-helix domain-containing protein [[Ruminococcus] torques]MCQ5336146.1 helix-turn-helix domain-containing protein [[Ruminococcus] torques]MCQ5348318.1 helix-turn-helix domain-containing protein [[Ruminococcus] torques]